MYPLWDAEWSLGLYCLIWGWDITDLPHFKRESKYLFSHLIYSRIFREEIKKQWNEFKEYIPQIKENIEKHRSTIELAQAKNKEMWPKAAQKLLVEFDTWEQEIGYINDYFTERVIFLDTYFNAF